MFNIFTGFVNVKLLRPGGDTYDHYQWNKVTTCVHNLFGGQRWVDQYGELKVTCGRIICKLTFVKVSTSTWIIHVCAVSKEM